MPQTFQIVDTSAIKECLECFYLATVNTARLFKLWSIYQLGKTKPEVIAWEEAFSQ